jgi:hypothetical protein
MTKLSIIATVLLLAGCTQAHEPLSVTHIYLANAYGLYAIEGAAQTLGAVEPVSILWEMGDGAVHAGESVSHDYGTRGEYEITVTAVDGAGRTASKAVIVTVLDNVIAYLESPCTATASWGGSDCWRIWYPRTDADRFLGI